eukprot:SAG11_NODE_6757_length_1253_cov_1.701906_1_plen_32_part_01
MALSLEDLDALPGAIDLVDTDDDDGTGSMTRE